MYQAVEDFRASIGVVPDPDPNAEERQRLEARIVVVQAQIAELTATLADLQAQLDALDN